MVVDTSAFLAILESESTAQRLIEALGAADALRVPRGTMLEAGINDFAQTDIVAARS
jgi:uncharacterized protein with PIN domain